MMKKNGPNLEKRFAEMDRKVRRLRAMLPVEFNDDDDKVMAALAALDDDQLATAKLVSDEIAATVADMEKLLCGR